MDVGPVEDEDALAGIACKGLMGVRGRSSATIWQVIQPCSDHVKGRQGGLGDRSLPCRDQRCETAPGIHGDPDQIKPFRINQVAQAFRPIIRSRLTPPSG